MNVETESFRELIFSDNLGRYFREDDRLVHIPKKLDKNALLNYLAKALNFPTYFGENWDALYDCLSSMDWFSEPRVILVHDGLPDLNSENLMTYLGILIEVKEFRKERCGEDLDTYPELVVMFPHSDYETVRQSSPKNTEEKH